MATEKRKDKRGRPLFKGEEQLKDGRYAYRYRDKYGQRQTYYSWKLVPNDYVPKGKKSKESIREFVEQLTVDKVKGIDTFTSKAVTLNARWELYLKQKYIKESTMSNYIYLWDKYVKSTLGQLKLSDINSSVVMDYYLKLYNVNCLSLSSVLSIHYLVHPVLDICVEDNLINRNYSTRAMKEIKKMAEKKEQQKAKYTASGNMHEDEERVVLSKEQEAAFLDFIFKDKRCNKWRNLLVVLLKTGMRIGEACALTTSDIDLQNGVLSISRNVQYRKINGKCRLYVSTTKTIAGQRNFPIYCDLLSFALKDEISKHDDSSAEIDGVSGWIFRNRYGKKPLTERNCNDALKRIFSYYNASVEDKKLEIHNFSCHNFRHTFISTCEMNNVPERITKLISGHGFDKNDVTNRYIHLDFDYIKEEAGKLLKNG